MKGEAKIQVGILAENEYHWSKFFFRYSSYVTDWYLCRVAGIRRTYEHHASKCVIVTLLSLQELEEQMNIVGQKTL